MINLFLNLIKESSVFKKKLIFLVRIANVVGYLGISLFFQLLVTDITSLGLWNTFFMIGWIFSISFILIIIFLNSKIQLFYLSTKRNQLLNQKNGEGSSNKIVGLMFILYIVFFLGSSDYMFMLLFSSWIFNKFGEISWRVYNSLYFVFICSEFLGNWIGYNISDKIDKRKLLLIGFYSYMFIMISWTVSSFTFLVILNVCAFLIGTICNFLYTSLVADISKNNKFKTFKYQLLHTYNCFARIVFIPLGFFLYYFITVESIMTISASLLGVSGIFILSTFLLYKN
jgi:hypothetical protein